MNEKRWLLLALVVLLILGWIFRFEYITPDHNSARFYKVNRWTGDTYICGVTACRELGPNLPPAAPQ